MTDAAENSARHGQRRFGAPTRLPLPCHDRQVEARVQPHREKGPTTHGQLGRAHQKYALRSVQERDSIAAHNPAAEGRGQHRCEQQHIDKS